MKVRFPTIYVLNKIDSPGADANVLRICDKYGDVRARTDLIYIISIVI